MKKNLDGLLAQINIPDEVTNSIWDKSVINCFKDASIEDAVRAWLKLYGNIRPELLGSAGKRESVFMILERCAFLPKIEADYLKYSTFGFSSRTFVTCLENLLDDVEEAISEFINERN